MQVETHLVKEIIWCNSWFNCMCHCFFSLNGFCFLLCGI